MDTDVPKDVPAIIVESDNLHPDIHAVCICSESAKDAVVSSALSPAEYKTTVCALYRQHEDVFQKLERWGCCCICSSRREWSAVLL